VFEHFAREARLIVVDAADEARRDGSEVIEPRHLLLALTGDPAVRDAGLDRDTVADALERDDDSLFAAAGVRLEGPLPAARPATRRQLPFAPATRRALEAALRAAAERGDRRVGGIHLLLGLLRTPAARTEPVLRQAGLDPDAIAAAL